MAFELLNHRLAAASPGQAVATVSNALAHYRKLDEVCTPCPMSARPRRRLAGVNYFSAILQNSPEKSGGGRGSRRRGRIPRIQIAVHLQKRLLIVRLAVTWVDPQLLRFFTVHESLQSSAKPGK